MCCGQRACSSNRGLTPLCDQGYRAGFIASSFMVGRMLSSSLWGPWSDRHGRRPVLVIGCLTIAITSVAFGFSFAYWWTIVIRFLGGLGNGITAAAKTCTAEVAPHSTHRSKGACFCLGRQRAHAHAACFGFFQCPHACWFGMCSDERGDGIMGPRPRAWTGHRRHDKPLVDVVRGCTSRLGSGRIFAEHVPVRAVVGCCCW